MACFLANSNDTSVSIPETVNSGDVTYYVISVKVGPVYWTVKQRYNGFLELHESLVTDHSISKDMLPPKKIIGNKDPSFIETRRKALEEYLSKVFNFLKKRMPKELVQFLAFNCYEILFLLQHFSSYLYQRGENVLVESNRKYKFCPLTLYAISERLKQPCPPLEIIDQKHDFSHVLDFCSQLKCIKVEGKIEFYKTSNIIKNELLFELSSFKNLDLLIFYGVNLSNIYGLGTIKETLKALAVKRCNAKSLGDILLMGEIHKTVECISDEKNWFKLKELEVFENDIEIIDDFIKLIPNVERLSLSENKIKEIKDMKALKKLTHLSLCANEINVNDDLSLFLNETIIYLDLSQNKISSLKGFTNLKRLERLDLSLNLISDLSDIKYIKDLMNLNFLNLTGNPVTTVIDYRVKVLEQFDVARAQNICLDNEKPTQKEIDTVSVLQALRIVKEGRTPTFNIINSFSNVSFK